jgi:AcrR family transcriptional regulator
VAGRPNQKQRTRKDLLQAAYRLMQTGRSPSLEEVAAEALVSRATAYRYFPSIEALLLEAALDVASPSGEALFAPGAPTDPVTRLERVDAAFDEMILANEPALRLMLARSIERVAGGDAPGDLPIRQNRRSPLIETALEPLRATADPATLDLAAKALAVIIGAESMIVLKDVLRVSEDEAREIRRWAIGALVKAVGAPGAASKCT